MDKYNLIRINRKKQFFRVQLGAQQFVLHPILNLLWLLPLVSGILIDQLKTLYFKEFSVAEIFQPIFNFSLTVAMGIIPIALTFLILQNVAKIVARKDEAKISLCFNKNHIENGVPILVSKKYGQNKSILIREFYTYIPKHIWEERMPYIEDIFNVRIISIGYGKRGNRIILTTAKGRTSPIEERICDETI